MPPKKDIVRAKVTLPAPTRPVCYPSLVKYRAATNATLKPNAFMKEGVSLRYYQVVGVLHMILMTRMVLGDGTGLGKTITAIATYAYLLMKDPTIKLMIVTPKSATSQWVDEFTKFTTGIDARRLENFGAASRREQYVQWANDPNRQVLVMHYHWFREDLRVYQPLLPKNLMVIFDEATAFKSYESKTHKAACEVGAVAQRCYGLTATLLKNNLIEGFGIYRAIYSGVFNTGITGFKKRYCVEKLQSIGARKVPVVVGYKNVEHFRDAIDPYFLGRKKHEVSAELPDLITKEVACGLTDVQWEAYSQALGELLTVRGEDKEVTPLSRLAYCQQIVDSPHLIGLEGPSEKEAELYRIIDEELEDDDHIIIFSRFRTMVDRLETQFAERGISTLRITGAESEEERTLSKHIFQGDKEAIRNWVQKYLVKKEDPREESRRVAVARKCMYLINKLKNKENPRIMLLTPAGTEALNLQSASVFIFYDSPWSPGDYEQLLGRMIRIGSVHKTVLVIHLMCKGTIDDHVMSRLREKAKIIKRAMGETTKGALTFDRELDLGDLMNRLRSDAARFKAGGRKALSKPE